MAEIVFKEVIAGVDWGYVNPSVILVIGLDYDKRAFVIDEFYERNILIDDLLKAAKDMAIKYNIKWFIADPSEPQFIQMFRNAGLKVVEANNEVIAGIQRVASYLEKQGDGLPKLFIDKKCKNTIMEFENYRYPDKKENRAPDEKPLKIYDHAMDALRYALMSIPQENIGFFIRGRSRRGT